MGITSEIEQRIRHLAHPYLYCHEYLIARNFSAQVEALAAETVRM